VKNALVRLPPTFAVWPLIVSWWAEPSSEVNVTRTEMNAATLAFVGFTPAFVPLNSSSVRAGSVPPLLGGGLSDGFVSGGFEGVVAVVVGVV
jgi:hypothetical protein